MLIVEDAFALKNHMMKLYPYKNLKTKRRVHNYRHSRARRISENLFGILANRWRIYHTVMLLDAKAVKSATLATLALNNMLVTSSAKSVCCPTGLCDTDDVNWELTLSRNVLSRKTDKGSQCIYRSQRNSSIL